MNRSIAGISVAIVVALLSIEICCALFFTIFYDRFTFFSPEKYFLEEEKFEKAAKAYHSLYGWMKYYDTPYGERPRKNSYQQPFMAVYGDSYTHCDQVDHDQTFEHYLSRRLKADIYNFGVGGFGTDQAFLRFRTEFERVNTPVVGLGLITENINRAVNVYRKFYYLPTALSIPKPRYVLEDGKLNLIENPLMSKEDIPLLRNAAYIMKLGKNDYWFNRDNYPAFGFPFTEILFNHRLWLEVMHQADEQSIDDIDPRPWEQLWDEEEPRELMYAIFDAFYEEAIDKNVDPVILLLPQSRELFTHIEGGEPTASRKWIIDYCKSKGYRCFDGIEAIAGSVKSLDEAKSLYHGHLTAEGNRRLSRALYRFLGEHGLIEKHLPESTTGMKD